MLVGSIQALRTNLDFGLRIYGIAALYLFLN
jgi:hypothetical protein